MDFEKEISDMYPWILQVARKFCRSTHDAEDLAGDTVYKMLVNMNKFDSAKPLKPWCLAIMQNTFITAYNRNTLVHFNGYDSVMEYRSPDRASDLVIFHDVLSIIHRCAQKTHCIDSVIYAAKGYSYDEISDILHIPVGTVGSRIAYGRRTILQEFGY